MPLTTSQLNSVHRIDRERQSCAGAIRTALISRAASLASSARRGVPIAPDTFTDSIQRLAMIAYLRGMKRTVLDASNALGRDVRNAHLLLSREEDKKREERDRLLWLLLFLGLMPGAIEIIRQRSAEIANAASRELTGLAVRKVQGEVAARRAEASNVRFPEHLPAASSGPNPQNSGLMPRRPGTADAPTDPYRPGTYRPSPATTATPQNVFTPTADLARSVGPAFDKAGIGKGSRFNIDTWAETVAYEQYEAGRAGAITNYPAVSEALWGYRWSSVLDTRTTAGCRALDGWVAPLEDSWQRALAPPRHWNCRAVLVPVYQSSRLKPPTPFRPEHLTDASLQRYLRDKEEFVRRLA